MKSFALIFLIFVISLLHSNSMDLQKQELNRIAKQTKKNKIIRDLEDFSSRFPDSIYGQTALLELAKIQLLQRDYNGSLQNLKKIHLKKINDKQYWMAKSYLNLNDYENAIVSAQNYIYDAQDFTKVELSYLLIAEAYIQKGLYNKALNTLENLRTSQYIINQIPLMLYKIGQCHESMKNYQDAANIFRKLKQDYPYNQFSFLAEESVVNLVSEGRATKQEPVQTTKEHVSTKKSVSNKKGMKDFLQAGAFSSFGNAEKMGKKIKTIGYKYEIYSKVKNGSKLFVVAVGPFEKVSDRDDAKCKLKDEGINSYSIKRF